jgi:hypothetical protein
MARFDSSNFMDIKDDDLDVFSAQFKNIRFKIPVSQIVEVDASTESNLPLLAEQYLGDQYLWWILLDYNGLVDPIEDIYPGKLLNIPDRRAVIALLDQQQNQGTSTNVVII